MDITKLAEYGLGGVAILLIVALCYVIDKFLTYLKSKDKRDEKLQEGFRKTINRNTKVVNQTYQYIKLRNGINGNKKKD